MDKTSLLLSLVFLVAMAVLIAPNIIAFNRGRMLRNITLWLAIFTGLALIYKNFGPGSEHQLFSLPPGIARRIPNETSNTAKPASDKTGHDEHGFTPPAE